MRELDTETPVVWPAWGYQSDKRCLWTTKGREDRKEISQQIIFQSNKIQEIEKGFCAVCGSHTAILTESVLNYGERQNEGEKEEPETVYAHERYLIS
ncbi:CLUMA_CG007573, isoform A [Clunio marinus]|uniref:CLUMA_CG007573, isoform A n=1 Tax=Clunio marinus TaxID=568069 RepID=A0A1J1I6L0_9DIPT|nr:CLUMA_CG007573, isoform A [Clunio marinus]